MKGLTRKNKVEGYQAFGDKIPTKVKHTRPGFGVIGLAGRG